MSNKKGIVRNRIRESHVNGRVTKRAAVQFLASHWKLLEKAYAEDNTKTVGQLMAEVEEAIAKEGYNVHEVLNERRTD